MSACRAADEKKGASARQRALRDARYVRQHYDATIRRHARRATRARATEATRAMLHCCCVQRASEKIERKEATLPLLATPPSHYCLFLITTPSYAACYHALLHLLHYFSSLYQTLPHIYHCYHFTIIQSLITTDHSSPHRLSLPTSPVSTTHLVADRPPLRRNAHRFI